MTTAARPTFDPARGNDSKAPTFQYSSRDLSAHTKLKYRSISKLLSFLNPCFHQTILNIYYDLPISRQTGQLTQEELENVDLKEELLKAEKEHFENIQLLDKKHGNDDNEDQSIKRRKLLLESTAQLDADDDDSDERDSDEDSDSR